MRFKIMCLVAVVGMAAVMLLSFLEVDKVEVIAEEKKVPDQVEVIRPDFTEDMSAMPCCEAEPVVLKSLGTFRLTAYCSCHKCCGRWAEGRPIDENGNEIVLGAAGFVLSEGYSIAVDPAVIHYGTKVVFNGHEYMAMDCGSGIDGNCIDVYFADHQSALNFGMQYAEVFTY